ncbi:ATP-binding protein [Streptomyces sp. NPDC059506]|uniref:ATP-binding protein n=1 Tax=Streptomyces sp. NPDC059506 TaxID=3347751 RepID=UPI0036CE82D1
MIASLRVEPAGFVMAFAARPGTVGTARRLAGVLLERWGFGDDVTGRAQLAVTELLTNVARHAAVPDCTLHLQPVRDGVRIAVADEDPRLPVVREPSWDSESGRGLFLLTHSVDAWGGEQRRTGKSVWVLVRPGPADAA